MHRRGFRTVVATATFILSLMMATPAGATQPADIVDTQYVADAVERGAILWDVRSERDYERGHIPGAVNVGAAGSVLRDDNREDYLSTPQIAKILGDAGIDLNKEIIAYSHKGNPSAYFGLVTIRHFGGKAGRVYHGGLDDWTAAGLPISTEPTQLTPVTLKLKPTPGVTVTTDEVIAKLDQSTVQILDVRTEAEHKGEDIRAIRGGHIRGAINIPYEENWLDPETPAKLAARKVTSRDGMSLKSLDALKALYAKLDPKKETIVYCQSGVRASQTATVLRDLGFKDVKVYDASWLGYAGRLDAPAENVTFANIGRLNARIRTLEYRIYLLERELAAARRQ
ncbi:MAG: rhodanese-like domain-containing protein [Acidiferrobacterales bacterium]|nr:rhodanese-like domain-containing protein [Acidiferrobacterales bacterium]